MALKELENNKALGDNGVTAELLKAGEKPVWKIFQKLFNIVICEGNATEVRRIGVVVLFFENGDNTLLKNCFRRS